MRRRLMTAMAVMLAAATMSQAQEKGTETSYFPLREGNTWNYKSGDTKFLVRVKKIEKVDDKPTALLETVKNDKVIAREHISVTDKGIVRLDVELVGDDPNITVKETAKPPILLLPVSPKKGDAFNVESKVADKTYKGTFKVDEGDITVAAGSYKKAVVVTGVDVEVEGIKVQELKNWYVEGIGLVKSSIVVDKETKSEWELEKFEPGK